MGGGSTSNMHSICSPTPTYSNLHLAYLHCGKILESETTLSRINLSQNIIRNPNFSKGLQHWNLNCCKGRIAVSSESNSVYAIATDKTQWWGHLEQDITDRLTAGVTYSVSAVVAASGNFNGCSGIQAVLRLEHHDSRDSFLIVSRIHVAKDEWDLIRGSFVLENLPKRVFFYLEGVEGHFAGVELFIKSVMICRLCPSISHTNEIEAEEVEDGDWLSVC